MIESSKRQSYTGPYWKSPKAIEKRKNIPWSVVLLGYAIAIAFGIYRINNDINEHSWSMPSRNELLQIRGTFSSTKPNIRSPYKFIETDGSVIYFGCEPNFVVAYCLENRGIPPAQIAGKEAIIDYFYFRNNRAPAMSNIIVDVNINGIKYISYNDSKKRLEKMESSSSTFNTIVILLKFFPFILVFSITTLLALLKFHDLKYKTISQDRAV